MRQSARFENPVFKAGSSEKAEAGDVVTLVLRDGSAEDVTLLDVDKFAVEITWNSGASDIRSSDVKNVSDAHNGECPGETGETVMVTEGGDMAVTEDGTVGVLD